ncbi:MAG: energy transducer TonB [Aestuariibacter sp.]
MIVQRKFLISLSLIATFSFSLNSMASSPESAPSELLDVIVAAQALERKEPRYPTSAAKNGLEGWAIVSFVVDKEGNVIDPIIEDSSGSKHFERSTLNAVEDWKYKPATYNGETIEQCKTRVRMDFRLQGKGGVTRPFLSRYRKTLQAVEENDLALAESLLQELDDRKTQTWDENGYFWIAKSYYHEALGQDQKTIDALTKVFTHGQGGISTPVYLSTMQRLFVANIENNKLAEAALVYGHINEIAPDHAVVQALAPYNQQVVDFIESQNAIQVSAKIEDKGYWSHRLARKQFDILVPEGQIDKVEIRCDNKRATYNSVEEHHFTIPDSWGHCRVYANGATGTEFTLIEKAHSS